MGIPKTWWPKGFLSMLMLLMAGTSTGLLVDTTDMCDILRVIDCNHHYHSNGDETVCCTDGKTYKNKCWYVQAKCDNIRLEPMHAGACTEEDKNPRSNMTSTNFTTDIPEAAQTIDNFTLTQEFCADPRPCPSDLNPICGNNRIFYVNLCDFNKAKCKVPDLEKIGLSDCKSTGVTRAFIEKFKRRRNRTKGSGK
ncbi:serine protease inhibitor Kazal-type 10-like [Magallana gigas]|uniref:serine protease inhibitor Kazal-type 10-like n=1 Tax=Magallana gigas TaxID=29159 RepID=UPI00333E7C3F